VTTHWFDWIKRASVCGSDGEHSRTSSNVTCRDCLNRASNREAALERLAELDRAQGQGVAVTLGVDGNEKRIVNALSQYFVAIMNGEIPKKIGPDSKLKSLLLRAVDIINATPSSAFTRESHAKAQAFVREAVDVVVPGDKVRK